MWLSSHVFSSMKRGWKTNWIKGFQSECIDLLRAKTENMEFENANVVKKFGEYSKIHSSKINVHRKFLEDNPNEKCTAEKRKQLQVKPKHMFYHCIIGQKQCFNISSYIIETKLDIYIYQVISGRNAKSLDRMRFQYLFSGWPKLI